MDDHGVSFDGVQSCYQVTFRQSDECLVPGAEALKNKSMWVSGSRFLIHKEVVIPHIFFQLFQHCFYVRLPWGIYSCKYPVAQNRTHHHVVSRCFYYTF